MKRILKVQKPTKVQERFFKCILILLTMSLVSIIAASFIDVEPGFWGTKKGTLVMNNILGIWAALSLTIDLLFYQEATSKEQQDSSTTIVVNTGEEGDKGFSLKS